MRINRWLGLLLIATSLAFLVDLGGHLLEDRRIRLRTLITLDPPASPTLVGFARHRFSVVGALVKEGRAEGLSLRAWSPTPTIHVIEAGGPGPVTVRVENLPVRVRLDAAGPAEEERAGLTRTLRFSPAATRRLTFVDLAREVTFAVLGDTGDDPTFSEALQLAARMGADFLIHAGDLIYADAQVPNIERILAASPIPIFMVRGNHDYRNTMSRRRGPAATTWPGSGRAAGTSSSARSSSGGTGDPALSSRGRGRAGSRPERRRPVRRGPPSRLCGNG